MAQPLLDLLGRNGTFFVAHGASQAQIIGFALALIVIPPLFILGVLGIIRLLSPGAARASLVGVVGLLVGLTVVPVLDRSFNLSTPVYIFLMLATSCAAGFCYRRFDRVRQYVNWLTPAPILFLVAFLFLSPVHTILFSSDPVARASVVGRDVPVVMVVFDEFPLGALLDARGTVDADRFPNFARLAATSTWYRNAATVARSTDLAVPAILAGTIPDAHTLPIASQYPRTLFTLLGKSHDLHVGEAVTRVCPATLCSGAGSAGSPGAGADVLYKDAAIVYLHQLLPAGLADAWLPPLGARWANFGADDAAVSESPEERTASTPNRTATTIADPPFDFQTAVESFPAQGTILSTFAASISADAAPGFYFQHVLLPHIPYTYLPDGKRYENEVFGLGTRDGLGLVDDEYLTQLARQQLLLQTAFTDAELGRVLDRLEQTDVFDDALVIVVADHGVNLERGESWRGVPLVGKSRDNVLPVPLFVKYPRQNQGAVDDRKAQTVDVLPTVADTLGIELPGSWAPDGQSLLAPANRSSYAFEEDQGEDPRRIAVKSVDATRSAARFAADIEPYSQTHDLFRLRPYGDLVGRSASELTTSTPPPPGVRVQSTNADSFIDVDLDEEFIPARFTADIPGAQVGDGVAVALNGTVAGTGRVFSLDGRIQTAIMVDPAVLRAGQNDIRAYLIEPDTHRLQRLE